MPRYTDVRIEEIIARIRAVCSKSLDEGAHEELKQLARELRDAIRHHVKMAKGSLTIKNEAILRRDPEFKLNSKTD
jgi:hypothetical protein